MPRRCPVPPLRAAVRDVISHIEVNNEGSYHSTALDRMAMAVTEEAPFHIDLETPAVPLVKGGVASLKVRASRKDGYNEPITLRIPWSPPGVSGPGTVTIPPGQTDALYELNANNDSAVGDWQICLAADADTPKGPVSVATSLVPLRVADPYVSLSIEMAAAEQGKPTRVVCKLDVSHDFAGAATAELIGLPHGAKTNPVTFTKEQREIVFPVEVAPDATPGKHNSLFCKISIPENNHVILHQLGQGGTLRIDKPLPAQVAQPTASPAPKPAVTPAGNQPKPLSHLEQLRQRANP